MNPELPGASWRFVFVRPDLHGEELAARFQAEIGFAPHFLLTTEDDLAPWLAAWKSEHPEAALGTASKVLHAVPGQPSSVTTGVDGRFQLPGGQEPAHSRRRNDLLAHSGTRCGGPQMDLDGYQQRYLRPYCRWWNL